MQNPILRRNWFVLTSLAYALSISSTSDAALPNRVKNVIKQRVAVAWADEDVETYSKLLENLLSRLDAEDILEVDQILANEGAPATGELLLDAQMRNVLGRNAKLANLNPREVAISMPVLQQRIQDLLAEVREMPVFAETLPDFADMEKYEEAFWDIHVASNRLKNAARMSRVGKTLVDKALEKRLNKLTDDEVANLEIDFTDLEKQLGDSVSELAEIKTELRIHAVAKATAIVRESRDFKERLRAAYVVHFDGQRVIDYLREQDISKLSRPLLRDPNLLSSVRVAVNHARENAGDVAIKARLLYLGMHWWMRGRYGEGPDGMGLLKSVAAVKSPLARFPLYMPERPPRPTDPASPSAGPQTPRFDRRHHYIWMYEYRQFQARLANDSNIIARKKTDGKITSRTKLSRFY